MIGHQPLNLLLAPLRTASGNVMPRILREHITLDASGRYPIHRDSLPPKIRRKALDHPNHGHLTRVVQRVILHPHQPRRDTTHQH